MQGLLGRSALIGVDWRGLRLIERKCGDNPGSPQRRSAHLTGIRPDAALAQPSVAPSLFVIFHPPPAAITLTQLLLNLSPPPPPGFANFIASGNDELLARLRHLAMQRVRDAVYLWGPPGVGKSHLLAAAASAAQALRPVHWLGESPPPTPGAMADALLLVDDVEALDATAQASLFRLLVASAPPAALLLAGAAPPLQLTALREDLRTRIGQCLVYALTAPDEAAIRAALHTRARSRGFNLDEGLVAYLLSRSRRDLPSLLAVLDELDRVTLEQQRPVTLTILKETLQRRAPIKHEPDPV